MTRARIIDAAVPIFNVKGYAGTSVADILEAADIQKGGLYRHFESKEALALEVFDRACTSLIDTYLPAMKQATSALDRLRVSIAVAANSPKSPPVPGGCPIMNTAIEADGTDDALRRRAARAMDVWRRALRDAVMEGIDDGSIRRDADPDGVASVLIASLEGAIMMTMLYRNLSHMEAVARHLYVFVDQLAREPRQRSSRARR